MFQETTMPRPVAWVGVMLLAAGLAYGQPQDATEQIRRHVR